MMQYNYDKREREREKETRKQGGDGLLLWQARTHKEVLLVTLWRRSLVGNKQKTTNKTTHQDDLNQCCCIRSLSCSFLSCFLFFAQTTKQTNTAPTTSCVTVSLHLSSFSFFSLLFLFCSFCPPTQTSLRHTSALCNLPAVWWSHVKCAAAEDMFVAALGVKVFADIKWLLHAD